MSQYIFEEERIQHILEELQGQYEQCKDIQQHYIAHWEANQVESPEAVMEVIQDLDTFAHSLVLLGKQWEQLQEMQRIVVDHYMFKTLQEAQPEASHEVAYEGYEGYDVKEALQMEYVEPEDVGLDQLDFDQVALDHMDELDLETVPQFWKEEELDDMHPWAMAEPIIDDEEVVEKKKKRCPNCTEDSPIPEEREACCYVKKEKKKKEKSKDKKKDKSITKWAKKLSKWERYAHEHGDEWTEKVLKKVAKKLEKHEGAPKDMKARFKQHKLDRFARLHEED